MILVTLKFSLTLSQDSFQFRVELNPVTVPNLPGIHSFAFAQHNGKWLVIGGRLDGIHARQPFNAFPENQNNKNVYVIDYQNEIFWSASLDVLPTPIYEQMQSTNINFYQDADTLYLIGGYAYSSTAQDHITFPKLTSIQVSDVMDAVINAGDISPSFKQIEDEAFAITGGQMGKLDDKIIVVGGHRFDGRYNPMGHSTYVQTYTNAIRTFKINNSGNQLSFSNFSQVIDPVHLRRRDFNLLPQIFENGQFGYTISSGVFQETVDLPFLYPVNINSKGYSPITDFNQYLSNYHCSKVVLHDEANNQIHNLFFGGISQYYYENNQLTQDELVPFVKTISRVSRFSDGSLAEFKLPVEMPGLKGASSEFILNQKLPHHSNEIIKLNEINSDTILIGYILGGIESTSKNPFSNNESQTTIADPSIYSVTLIRDESLTNQQIIHANPNKLKIYPTSIEDKIYLEMSLIESNRIEYHITSEDGQLLQTGEFDRFKRSNKKFTIKLDKNIGPQNLFLTVSVDNIYFYYEKILKK